MAKLDDLLGQTINVRKMVGLVDLLADYSSRYLVDQAVGLGNSAVGLGRKSLGVGHSQVAFRLQKAVHQRVDWAESAGRVAPCTDTLDRVAGIAVDKDCKRFDWHIQKSTSGRGKWPKP